MKRGLFVLGLILLAQPVPVLAQGSKTSSPVELARMAGQLKPGQWVWAPEIAPTGPLMVLVDLSAQVATVYRNGLRIGVTTVSTGKAGHETPTGVFKVSYKDADHHSNLYHNASMPFTQRFTMGGVALHAGGLPGYPESHGCVHMPYAFARLLFGASQVGMTVVVSGKAAAPSKDTVAGVMAPGAAPAADGASYFTPEKSPAGPVSIVISRSDQAAVILRNGVEIGRTPVELPRDVAQTAVYMMKGGSVGEGISWIRVDVPGHGDQAGQPVDPAAMANFRVPDSYYKQIGALLVPGTTVLVTQAPLATGEPGRELQVLSGEK